MGGRAERREEGREEEKLLDQHTLMMGLLQLARKTVDWPVILWLMREWGLMDVEDTKWG